MRFFYRTCFVITVILGVFSITNRVVHADAFNQNRIIDDIVFDNSGSMSAAQIDAFLNKFSGSCISPNSGFKAIDPTGYNPSQGYQYGGYVTAGQVIYDSAQAYGINPQVLITTLEKEQSLVTGQNNFSGYCNNGEQHKYAASVGYGCPDSGTTYNYTGLSLYQRNGNVVSATGTTCVNSASKAGFSQQVIRAAWLFKFGEQRSKGNVGWAVIKGNWNNSDDPQTCYGGPMTQGTWQRCPSGGSTYYDGYTTIDSTAVHMDDGATAALYWYTPHFHGNQNFSSLFTQWFGLPYATKILKADSDPAFYLYNNGQKLKIPSYALYLAYGFNKVGVTIVSNDYLASIPSGNDLSNLARGIDGTVHLIAYGKRYIVTSSACTNWALDCTNPYIVNTIDSDMLNVPSYAGYLQPLMKNQGVVYDMVSGTKEPFLNTQAILQNGFGLDQATDVEDMSAGQTLGPLLPSTNTAFKFNGSGAIMLYTPGKQYVTIGDMDTFYAWGLDAVFAPSVPTSSLDSSIPTSSATLNGSNRLYTAQSKKYLIDGGHKLDLTQVGSDWPGATTTPYMDQLATQLPTVTITSSTCFRSAAGSVFQVSGSVMRPIRSYTDIYALGCSANTLVAVSNASVANLTTGADMLPLSTPFKKPGDDGIYVVDSSSSSSRLSSYAEFTALGFVPGDVYSVNSATAAAYPTTVATASYGQKNGVFYIFSPSNKRYLGSKDVLTQWGVNNFNPIYAGLIGDRLSTASSALFAHTQSGAIYYASGGSKHLITNYAAYVRLGGNPTNTMEVFDDFMNSLPTGASTS